MTKRLFPSLHGLLASERSALAERLAFAMAPLPLGPEGPARVDPLLDGLLQLLSEGRGEGLVEAAWSLLGASKTPLAEALVVLGRVRREIVRALLAKGGDDEVGAADAIAVVDEVLDAVSEKLAARRDEELAEARRECEQSEAHHRWFFDRVPAIMHSIDAEGRLVAVNDRWVEKLQYDRSEVIGRRSSEFLTPESAKYAREVILPAFYQAGRCDDVAYQMVRKDGSIIDVSLSAIAERDASGKTVKSQAVLLDVTAWRAAERAASEAARQEEVIAAQREMLRALSTPLVPLGDGMLLMPLVGTIDAGRADQIMAALLEGVVANAAEVAILDVTGVPAMDVAVAEALAAATKAVGLLGARVVLTGISPAAAQALVEIGAELSGIVTKATLKDGIRAARSLTFRGR